MATVELSLPEFVRRDKKQRTTQTLNEQVKKGRIPGEKRGGRWYVWVDENDLIPEENPQMNFNPKSEIYEEEKESAELMDSSAMSKTLEAALNALNQQQAQNSQAMNALMNQLNQKLLANPEDEKKKQKNSLILNLSYLSVLAISLIGISVFFMSNNSKDLENQERLLKEQHESKVKMIQDMHQKEIEQKKEEIFTSLQNNDDKWKSKLSEVESESKIKIETSEEKIALSEKQLSEKTQRISSLEKEINDLKLALKSLQASKDQSEKSMMKSLESKLNSMNQEITDLKNTKSSGLLGLPSN